jgi:hypothetical protein
MMKIMKLDLHSLSASSFLNLVKLLLSHRVETKYWPKVIGIAGLSLCGSPWRQVSKLQLSKKTRKFTFEEDPVFILGHWRSGTTYLHHLMSRDRRFSYVSSYQAWAPELFLGIANNPLIRFLVSSSLPKKRPMDNIELSLIKPEEELIAMSKITQYSYYHAFIFPKETLKIFDDSVLLKGISPVEKELLSQQYIRLLKRASMSMGGKRLLLKSPDNMAKIPILIDLFPNAKFIHIYRNPYVLFFSLRNWFLKMSEISRLQDMPMIEDVEKSIIYIYEKTMKKYFKDKQLIPEGNMIEIRYEDLEKNPIDNLYKIYDVLDLADFDRAKDSFIAYTQDNLKYRKNAYNFEPRLVELIYNRWKFTIDLWGYKPPFPMG